MAIYALLVHHGIVSQGFKWIADFVLKGSHLVLTKNFQVDCTCSLVTNTLANYITCYLFFVKNSFLMFASMYHL